MIASCCYIIAQLYSVVFSFLTFPRWYSEIFSGDICHLDVEALSSLATKMNNYYDETDLFLIQFVVAFFCLVNLN